MNSIRFIISFFFCISLFSCHNNPVPGVRHAEWFVDSYFNACEISIENEELVSSPDGSFLILKLEGSGGGTEEFRRSIGDYGGDYARATPSCASINRFEKVIVTSDKEFNGTPAGKPIENGIFICAATAYPEIINKKGGYADQESFAEKGSFPFYGMNRDYYWYRKNISNLEPDDLFLLDRILYLQFVQIPNEKEHNLTISFCEAFRDLSVSGRIVFE